MQKFNLNTYKEHLKTESIGKNIIYLEKVDSTNNYAFRLLKNKLEKKINGTIILSETQNKGRGRLERQWISPPGGLWFTILLKTELEEKKLPEITLIAASAVTSVLKRDYNINTTIKWPNDIYYKEFKLGGILTEAEKINNCIFLVIGTGINVNIDMKKLSPLDKRAVSVRTILAEDIKREHLLAKILYEFEEKYNYYLQTADFNTIFKEIEKIIDYGM